MGQWYFGVPGGNSRIRVVAALTAATLVAWLLVVARMGGMDDGPGTDLGTAGWFLGIWVTMMAAMMLPSAAPMVLLYSRLAQESTRRSGLRTALFVAGYIVTWAAFGLGAYVLFRLVRALDPAFLAWDRGGPYVAGAAIAFAGVYQLTPLKRACLRGCRTPLGWLTHHWRDGQLGALRMGIEHGGWCVGCCWALMLVLFAVGVMSITWMLVVAAVIFAEKVLPVGERVAQAVAVVLVAAGIWVAVAPASVPGLTTAPGGMEMATLSSGLAHLHGGSRGVLRVLQLRGDLPVPDGGRRQGRPLDVRHLLRRALVARRGGPRRRGRPERARGRRSRSATTTTSPARRGASSSTSTSGETRSSGARSRRS